MGLDPRASGPDPIVVCGLGPIGARVAELAAQAGTSVVLVDLDTAGARNRLGSHLDTEPIVGSLGAALDRHAGASVVLCTTSDFETIVPDLDTAIAAGSSVITTCEEALWPFVRHPEVSRRVDTRAREAGVTILGLGINPGFLMDFLPAALGAAFPPPECIRVERRVDVATRRAPLQAKVGVGLTVDEFRSRKAGPGIGHRGLAESLHFLGAALGVSWDRVETDVEPVIAPSALPASGNALGVAIPEGGVIGMRNTGQAWLGSKARVQFDLVMALDLDDPVDRIELSGQPPFPVRSEVPGGVPGDDGTAHVVLNSLPRLGETAPGLRTILDVPGGLRGCWRP